MTDRGLKIKESPDDADLTFPNWHHPNIIQGLKKKTIAVTGRYVAPTDIFQPTLHSIFYKRCPIIFLYDRGSFFVRCRLQKLQCGLARFPRASRTEVVFRPTLACSHLVGQENISPPRKKKKHDSPILIEKKTRWRRSGKMTDPGLKKKNQRMTPMDHFLIDIIQILSRDWIEKTIVDIGR